MGIPCSASAPDLTDIRLECIGGTVVLSAPSRLAHHVALAELLLRFGHYCSAAGGWFVCPAPFDVVLDSDTLGAPDLGIFRMRDGARYPASLAEVGPPVLLVEVLTPDSAEADRGIKRRRYQHMGAETLLVDLEHRNIERWLPEAGTPEILIDRLMWRAPEAARSITLDLPRFFARILGRRWPTGHDGSSHCT